MRDSSRGVAEKKREMIQINEHSSHAAAKASAKCKNGARSAYDQFTIGILNSAKSTEHIRTSLQIAIRILKLYRYWVKAKSASPSATEMTEMIQKRIVTFDSGQPIASK